MKKEVKASKKSSDCKSPVFMVVAEDIAFHVIDGQTLRDLFSLAEALHDMSDDTYYYHSNKDKDDFAAWVKDVFHIEELAEEMHRTAHTRVEEEACILRYLVRELKKCC